MNIAESLARHARSRPDHPAILFEGRAIGYGALDRAVTRLAAATHRHGLRPGDRVALFLPNVPAFALCYLAAQRAGLVPVSINAMFRGAEIAHLVNDSGAAAIFTVRELAGLVPRADCPALRHVVTTDDEPALLDATARHDTDCVDTEDVTSARSLADWTAGASATFEPVDRSPDDPAALLYSSGTTGFPKGVTLTQSNVASNVATAAKYLALTPADRLAAFLPLFHVYGQNFILNAALRAGATVSLFRRFVPDEVMSAIGRDRITCFFGVPTIFINLLATDLSKWDLSSLRYEMSAAATMPEEISRRWTERFGRRIFEGYGLTECSPFACYNDLVEHRFGSVGRAVEGFELRIADEQDRELPRGEWGEILIRGPGVMQGYWNRHEDTARALRGGWLHSGDIGRMDADGYVYIVDRVKDMINVSGFKVWPAEVEQYLYGIEGVREVAVYGLPDPVKGERVAVSVVPKPGARLTPEGITAWCRERLAAYKTPSVVEIVDELPKSATGKVLKRVLRERGGADGA